MDTPFPLGGRSHKDPKSLLFPLSAPAVEPKTVHWRLYGDVLDQGNWYNPHIGQWIGLGSCTGSAKATLLNCRHHHKPRTRLWTNDDGVKFYIENTKEDPWPGEYDPVENWEDTGSSMVTSLSIAKRNGHIRGWENVFSKAQGIAAALQRGPVQMATRWTQGMFRPRNVAGYQVIDPSGSEAGWHCWTINRYNRQDRLFGLPQTWGTGWGRKGHAWIDWDGLEDLMSDGQAALPIPA